ncbi:inositol monophosphatase [Fomitiporia mediterranea MF3/22]|uniref:inositol monophosphatase n=1 Tax=Fomitiporia mediterranea (strain MF3/22) TaxID=694068 RepID=UPI0004409A77|nr:inositol monophosphatase [Fomitiporia mediterranea MF3/22]EJD03490.1 inositol monophosphatase [Fomitiporia mediterranea MF3/22]
MASSELSSENLKEILEFSKVLAREAGKLILEGSDAILRSNADAVGEKKNSVDLITQYDKAVEDLVRKRTGSAYPSFGFIGEEETAVLGKLPELTDGPIFCVDPIDGTTNFVHGFPFACISIGLINRKRPVLGVIYNPFIDWLYYGALGHGSYLVKPGGAQFKLPLAPPRPLPSLSQALIAVEWGSDRGLAPMKARADSFVRLAGDGEQIERGKMAHSLRSMGSAALNFAAVASGSLDLYWEIGCWPWDVCAGTIIAQEAGGIVSTSDLSVHGGEVTGDMSDKVLTGRKYIVMRAIADSEREKGVDIQRRLIKEFCETVEDFTPSSKM